MDLPPDLFAEITRQPDLHLGAYRSTEHRGADRVWMGQRAMILVLRPGASPHQSTITVREMSVRGVGLLHTAPLPVHQPFILSIARAAAADADEDVRPNWAHIECAVVRCHAADDGGNTSYLIGATFTRLVDVKAPIVAIPNAASAPANGGEEIIRIRAAMLR